MKEICNQGLGKIGASRLNNVNPPISVLEVKCVGEFQQWKTSELQKRRWVFATVFTALQALPDMVTADDKGRIYKFNKPGDMLRPVRPANCTWVRRGQFFYDRFNVISLEYIRNVPDNEMDDPLFIDVLAARVGVECVELATQSPGKRANILGTYKDAIDTAGRLNAFVLDPHALEGDELAYTWDVGLTNPELSGQW